MSGDLIGPSSAVRRARILLGPTAGPGTTLERGPCGMPEPVRPLTGERVGHDHALDHVGLNRRQRPTEAPNTDDRRS